MANKLVNFVMSNYDKIVLSSAAVGANVGTYSAHKEGQKGFLVYVQYAGGGAIFGLLAGAVSPIVLPAVAIGAPGYALSRMVHT